MATFLPALIALVIIATFMSFLAYFLIFWYLPGNAWLGTSSTSQGSCKDCSASRRLMGLTNSIHKLHHLWTAHLNWTKKNNVISHKGKIIWKVALTMMSMAIFYEVAKLLMIHKLVSEVHKALWKLSTYKNARKLLWYYWHISQT